jgi:hypothetical protein
LKRGESLIVTDRVNHFKNVPGPGEEISTLSLVRNALSCAVVVGNSGKRVLDLGAPSFAILRKWSFIGECINQTGKGSQNHPAIESILPIPVTLKQPATPRVFLESHHLALQA